MKVTVLGQEFRVEYKMSGLLDDAELDEVAIFVGAEEVCQDVLRDEVLEKIDEACYEDFWSNAKEGPEPNEEDR